MYLYRKWRWAVTLVAAVAALSPVAGAQWRRAPPQERTTPRAVAVLETYADGQRRLIPVSFFYERHYYDAGLYRAAPVPLTLSSETVYEVEQFGKALGTFTVLIALREPSRSEAAWIGSGRYRVAPDLATLARKRAAQLVVVEDSTRPVLHRRAGSEGDSPARHGAVNADDDADRPVLHRRDDAGDGKPAAGATAASSASSASTSPASAKQAAASAAGEAAVAGEEADHPILRRGKPRDEQGGADLPEFNAAPAVSPGTGEPVARGPEPMARQVAVSDAGTSEPQDVTFACRAEQRQQMESEAREMAAAELRKAAQMRGLVLPVAVKADAAKVVTTGSAKAKTAASGTQPASSAAGVPAALTFDDEQFVPYDLDYNDYATVVFSGRYRPSVAAETGNASLPAAGAQGNASLPAAGAQGNASLPAAGAQAGAGWVVTVIARQDGDKLVKLYSAVSDPKELDLYPEVRLVDAVDPDGYGRYALLFREQGRDGVKWLLGRATGYELETLFETAER